MKQFFLLFLFSVTVSAKSILPGDGLVNAGGQGVIIDYPEVLKKAGVKKIHCIFKDSRKFIWIGAENGLYRYDGSNLDLLEHDANSCHTIPNNNIVSIVEDKNGNIWVGTAQGAAMINAKDFSCRVFNKMQRNLSDDSDVKMYSSRDGKIWAGGSTGLSLFDERAGAFKHVWSNSIKGVANSGYVNCLMDWKNDTLAAGTFNGTVLINKKDFGFRRVQPIKQGLTVMRLFVDKYKRLWMGTWGDGLIVSDTICKTFTALKWEKPLKYELTNVITGVISTGYNNEERLWASTPRGVYELKHFTEKPSAVQAVAVTSLTNGFINNIMADDEQYIWESGQVVSRFFAGDGFFNPLPMPVNGLVQRIQPISIGNETNIAISSWYRPSGLVVANTQGTRVIYRQPPQTNLDASNVSAIAEDRYHRFWVSSLAGIRVFDSKFKPINAGGLFFNGESKLPRPKTNGILINQDTVWVTGYRKGIDLYDLKFHKIKSFIQGDGSGLDDNLFNGLFTDSHGNVWVFGDHKLYKYDKEKGIFKAYNFNSDGANFTTNDIAEMAGGDLLVASGSGLFRFNPTDGTYTRIFSPLLARANQILSVCLDDRGDVWFINNEHLVYYQLKIRHFTFFGTEDGLDTVGDLQWLSTVDGKLFYLAEDGQVVTFSPGNQVSTPNPIKLYIHALQVNDSTLNRSTLGKPVYLKYNENEINIEFGAINYIKPGQNLYAYRLSGVDKKWVFSAHNYVSYANLAPGSYAFVLKAENYAGLWSSPISIDITIRPPFWETLWFRLLSVVVVSTVLLVAIRYVLQRNLREKILLLEKEKAIEQERNRIARDMHDDLGSGLTKIAVLSEVTKAQISNRQSATTNLDVISTASRELVDSLQGIIWVLNPENDSVESLVLYLKEYTESFFELTPACLQFVYDDSVSDITLSEEKRRNIFLVVKECCNNILKHAGCTQVVINITMSDKLLLIGISDNGRGFNMNHSSPFSNGLQNMRNRIKQIGGKFRLISEPGHGTQVKCRIPV